tara:strand:+ start:743 stop:1864 length:1122 start_codon:yes stop_codon:yes gene_type:complete
MNSFTHDSKALFVDPFSYGIAPDYYWISLIKNKVKSISYIGSYSTANSQYLNSLKSFCKSIYLYNISRSFGFSILSAYFNILLMYSHLFILCFRYELIIYRWLPIPIIDLIIIFFFRHKTIFICDNHIPHQGNRNSFLTIEKNSASYYLPHLLLIKLLNYIYFPSKYTLSKFRYLYPSNKCNFRICQHGIHGMFPYSSRRSFPNSVDFRKILFWGVVQKYKGIDKLLQLSSALAINNPISKLSLEIHGLWKPDLLTLKHEFINHRTYINDKFLTSDEIENILNSDSLFVLPYNSASQSGILYTLLFYGCYFLSTDVGETGYLLKSYNLEYLLTDDFSYSNIINKISYITSNTREINYNLSRLRDSISWTFPLS